MVTFHRSHGNLSLETLSKWTSEQNRPLWRRVYLSANPTPALPNVGLLSASTKTRLVGGLEGLHRIAADCTDEAGRFSWCQGGTRKVGSSCCCAKRRGNKTLRTTPSRTPNSAN